MFLKVHRLWVYWHQVLFLSYGSRHNVKYKNTLLNRIAVLDRKMIGLLSPNAPIADCRFEDHFMVECKNTRYNLTNLNYGYNFQTKFTSNVIRFISSDIKNQKPPNRTTLHPSTKPIGYFTKEFQGIKARAVSSLIN